MKSWLKKIQKKTQEHLTVRLGMVRAALHLKEAVAVKGGNLIVGPWYSEVGFELLYWVPFLRWVRESFALNPGNILVLSRGGVDSWYRDIATRYVDIFDYVTLDDFRAFDSQRKLRKQLWFLPFDRFIVEKAAQAHNLENYRVLHPLAMYRRFLPFWLDKGSDQLIARRTIFAPFTAPAFSPTAHNLPEHYAAVKFYFNQCFPRTPANEACVKGVLELISRELPVVSLETNLNLDDHRDVDTARLDNIYAIKNFLTGRDNLKIQTQVVSRASLFVGNYGGFAYLPTLLGIPAFLFHDKGFASSHFKAFEHFLKKPPFGRFSLCPIRDPSALTQLKDFVLACKSAPKN